MNQAYSSFQNQFPLDVKKKFWKKMFNRSFAFTLLFLAILVPFYLIIVFATKQDGSVPSVVWYIFFSIIFLWLLKIWFDVWYIKAYIKRYYYSADQNFLTIKKKVFTPTEIHVQYPKIQDVYVDQDLLDRMMGLYDVHIASATVSSGIEAHIDGVSKETAEGIKNFLLGSIQGNMPNQNSQNNSQAQNTPTQLKFSSSEEISSSTYPLSSKWVFVTFFSRIISAIFYVGLILLYFFSKTKEGIFTEVNYSLVFIILIAVIIWNVISFLLWKKNYAFKFNEDSVYYKVGVFSINEKHMPYNSIQDVNVSQSFWGKIFGLSRVVIQDATQVQVQPRSNILRAQGVIIEGLNPAQAQKIAEVLREVLQKRTMGNANGL